MPRAADLPSFKVGNHVTACTHNPIGIKGVGEVGAIGVPPAVINAVIDALAPLGVTDMSMPATPEKVWRAIQPQVPKNPQDQSPDGATVACDALGVHPLAQGQGREFRTLSSRLRMFADPLTYARYSQCQEH